MKQINVVFAILSVYVAYSQNSSSFEIEFNEQLYFDTPSDSLKYYEFVEQYKDLSEELFYIAEKQIVNIKKDTIFITQFPKKNGDPKVVLIRDSKRIERLDLDSGRKIKWINPYTIKKYRKLNNYKRIASEDKTILNKPCEAWMATSKSGWNKIWISKVKLKDAQFHYPDLIVNEFLVLKHTLNINGKNMAFEAKSIKAVDNPDFGEKLEEHLKIDIKDKYLPISDNARLNDKPIRVGNTLDNYRFRNVFENDLIQLHEITKQKQYTIMEFWGTWCVPCLLANKKIKALKQTYDDRLSILSINAYDRNIDKLKKVIEKKQMDWEHGYATEKLLKVFNKKNQFPRLVILNNKNQVLFMGNPQVDLEEIKSILDK